MLVPYFFLWSAIDRFARSFANSATDQSPQESLDEREAIIRGKVYERAYKALGSVFMVLSFLIYLTGLSGVRRWLEHLPPDFSLWFAVWIILYFPSSLPQAILAWTQPDLKDFDDEVGREPVVAGGKEQP
jgi:hypothetical protein